MLIVKFYLNNGNVFQIPSSIIRYFYENAHINGKSYKTKRLVIETIVSQDEHRQLSSMEAANETFLIECSEFFSDEETTMCRVTHMENKCIELELL